MGEKLWCVEQMLVIIVGASEKLGGELAEELILRGAEVLLITRLKNQEIDLKQQLVEKPDKFSTIKLKSYSELASSIEGVASETRNISVIYLISARGLGTLTDMMSTVIFPIQESLAITSFDTVKHILISSQLSEQIGFEKSLTYHLEKSILEKLFIFYAIRGEINGARYNIIRITHLLTRNNLSKYFEPSSGRASKTLLNIPYKEIPLPSVSDLANSVELFLKSDCVNGTIIDLDQGGRFISATSERSGFKDSSKFDYLFKED